MLPWSNNQVTLYLNDVVKSGMNLFANKQMTVKGSQYTEELQSMFIEKYRHRQIGFETVARFRHALENKINELDGYYKRLYETIIIMDEIADPFGNVDVTETYTRETTSSDTATGSVQNDEMGSVSGEKVNRYTDTPQSKMLSDYGNIENRMNEFLTNATIDNEEVSSNNESSSTSSSSSNGTVTDTYTLNKKGNQGVNTYAHDMKELRETIINFDKQYIDEFDCLFLQIF